MSTNADIDLGKENAPTADMHAAVAQSRGVTPVPVAKEHDGQTQSGGDDAAKPEPAKGLLGWFSEKGAKMRKAAITATPAAIVNNSSNVIGAMHVGTEVLMFKSGMKEGKLVTNPENPINWVKQPIERITKDLYAGSKARDFSFKQLITGNPVKNFHTFITDTHGATNREASRQLESGKIASKVSLGNPWQTRTTFAGCLIWALSAILPEKKDSDKEVERMATMRTLHPMQYIGERLKQAVWFPEWSSHKRQMIGLGYVVIGICSTLGSWRQRRDLLPTIAKDAELISKGLKQTYTFNGAYLATSAISFLSSIPLLFALDENKGYSTFGLMMMGRIPFMPKSISKKYRDRDPGAHSYTAGMVSFQVENALQGLIGGATKLPDGTIVDHEDEKKKAISEAKEYKRTHGRHYHASNIDTPTTAVSHATTPERAMPERMVEAAAKEASAAV